MIGDAITDILVPDVAYIENAFNEFIDELKIKFGIDTEVFENLFTDEEAVTDVEGDYSISGVGTFNLTFLDTSFFVQGVDYFRPFVRGFLVLMILLYHIKQIVSFFGYDSGVVAGRSEHIASEKAKQD